MKTRGNIFATRAPARSDEPVREGAKASWPWQGLLIVVAILIAYLPALDAGFIWDDIPGHVTAAHLRSWDGLARIWFDVGATQQYYPLLHTAFWLEHQLWGDAPFGYHLVNILLHAASACLVGVILRRLAVPGAWLAAGFFALHPVCVESVAWVSEQKNTLSTVLYLGAALTYLGHVRGGQTRSYATATVLFVLALLTKTVTATLPAALLVILWWSRGSLQWRRDFVPLLPWFGLGAAAGSLTAWVEYTELEARGDAYALGALERTLLAGRAVWFYLGKLLWPRDLIFIYPRWTIDSSEFWQYCFPLAVLAALGALWWRRRHQRGPLAGALFFVGTLFPALGFVNVFPFIYSFVADHFQYVASLGVFALLGAGGAIAIGRLSPWVGRAGSTLLLALLGMLTWRQTGQYRDEITLYQKTIEKNPSCWMAHNNLAEILVGNGRVEEAIPHYEVALKFRPNYAEAANNLGRALRLVGRPADALELLQRGLELDPKYAEGHSNLGITLIQLGRVEEGIVSLSTAVRLQPSHAPAHCNLGIALVTTGRPGEAILRFERAVILDPASFDAELNWGVALVLTNRLTEAFVHFQRAIALRPDSSMARTNLGRALAMAGRYDEAIRELREALELQPANAEAHFHLSRVLRQVGRREEAAAHDEQARRLGWRY